MPRKADLIKRLLITFIGYDTLKGSTFSAKTRQKISETLKGKKRTKGHEQKLLEANMHPDYKRAYSYFSSLMFMSEQSVGGYKNGSNGSYKKKSGGQGIHHSLS